jgi:predicted N-acyltransferase
VTEVELQIHTSIEEIDRGQWNGWFGDDYPFTRWEFLRGLEQTGCTNAESGWQPAHVVLRDGDTTLAAVPAYLKNHSYGEYVFDWSWADAWRRAGLNYYPKLVTAIPFTPATGPRFWPATPDDRELDMIVTGVTRWLGEIGASSWHCLFVDEALSAALDDRGLHRRHTTQFHWFNRNYRDFQDFLDRFSSRKRKNLRRERRSVEEQGLTLETLVGEAITADDWAFFHRCYQMTYAKRSGHAGYLTGAFFLEACPKLGEVPVMVLARSSDRRVAAALYFQGQDTLYGRYWGCIEEFDALHFEACYYRGIEYCIDKGLQRFDPGAQGEHKIQRGFEPVLTHSNHWIAEPALSEAVADFTAHERRQTKAYCEQAKTLLPFKEDPS